MIADSVAFLKQQGREVVLRLRALLRRLSRRSATTRWRWSRPPPTPAPTGSPCATPTAAASPGPSPRWSARARRRSPRGSASTPTTTATWRSPTPSPAIEAGCTQVQGTMNGWGERCGNANLISIIAGLQLKMGRRCVPEENLARLTRAVAGGQRNRQHPPARARPLCRSVGLRAQGRHARRRGGEDPRQLRAHRRPSASATGATLSSRSCRAAATSACAPASWGSTCRGTSSALLEHIKELESQGYQFEAAEGSFELLGRRSQPGYVAAVRRARRGGHLRAAPRQLDVRRGDREAEDRRPRSSTRSRRARARCTRSTARFTRR